MNIGLLERIDDALREKRSVFRIAEPVVRLHQLLIQRHEPELVVGRVERVWADNADTVAAKIYGPHFEDMARWWCFEHAAETTLGGRATTVRPTEIPCRDHRHGHELDVVVSESTAHGADRITAIGEAKGRSRPWAFPHWNAWNTSAASSRAPASARCRDCSCAHPGPRRPDRRGVAVRPPPHPLSGRLSLRAEFARRELSGQFLSF
jgi:hypothetical protein